MGTATGHLNASPRGSAVGVWLGPGLAVAGVALRWVWAPAAVAVSFVGVLLAFASCGKFNSAAARARLYFAIAAHGAAIALASGRPGLAVIPVLALVIAFGGEGVVRRTGYHMEWPILVGVAAALVALALQWPVGSWGWALAPTFLMTALFVVKGLTGRRQLANLAKPSWRIKLGEAVPDFEAPPRLGGAPFRLSDEKGRFVLLCFLRGDWCPICQIMMRMYQRDAPELARHNVKLVAVSPSTGPAAESLARAMGLDFALLVDPTNHIAGLFGAVQPQANAGLDAPLPASFLIDPAGVLRHASKPDDVASFLDPRGVVPLLERMSSSPPPPA